ncbi:MAG: HEAT repeat domain-containing protein [Bryobacteraceae bacterium]|nr:HEAT repeat domain-containing protein [Bryobacteraceae bacterium]
MRTILLLLTALSLTWTASAAPPPSAAELDAVFNQVAAYQAGADRSALAKLDEWLRQPTAGPALRSELERRLIRLIRGKATPAGIEEACRRLSLIGTEASVPALERLLAAPATAEMARYALERIPGRAASQALRNALAKAEGGLQISLINSLGARRDAAAVPALQQLAQSPDGTVAAAAILALAQTGTAAACRALDRMAPKPGTLENSFWEARLRCAAQLAASGGRLAAYESYVRIHGKASSSLVRAAALKQMARLDPARSQADLLAALRSTDPTLQAAAVWALASMERGRGIPILREEFPRLRSRAQAQVLAALTEHGDASLKPLFMEAASRPPEEVQLAALDGLARHGDGSAVPFLSNLAASGQEPLAAAARRALVSLPGPGVDEAIVAAMAHAEPKARIELVRAAGERGASAANTALLRAAWDPDAALRREALRALSATATERELPALAELVAQPLSAADLREAQRTLAAVFPRLEKASADPLLAAYEKAKEPDPRAALLTVMAQSGRPEFLPLLRRELRSSDAPTRRAAIVALGQWPAPEPMPDLLETARKDSSPALRTLALRSYIRLAGLPSDRTPEASATLLAEALKLAAQAEEKKSILGLLPRFPCAESLELAQAAVADPALAAEAKAAVEAIRKALKLE